MRLLDVVWTVSSLAIAGYVLLAALITLLQRRLVYKPDPRRATPGDCGLTGVDAVQIATGGETLQAWYAEAPPGRPTILYFHGNAGWIELRADRLADLQARGFGVLMPFYRGYGGSTGRPSESANVADAKIVYDWLRRQGVASRDIVLFGESLGTGVATQLAAAKVSAGLVLDSPYTSMTDLARRDYPWLPVRYLLWDHYETLRHIKRVTVPVLVIHGEADALVPFDMGLAVHAAVLAPKRLAAFKGAPHLEHKRQGSFRILAHWIDSLRERSHAKEKPGTGPGFERLNPYG